MVANIPPIEDANAAGPPDPQTPDMVLPAAETEVPDAAPDLALSPPETPPTPEPEEETSEQFMRRLVEENSWRMKPRPPRPIPPPEPKSIHLMTPEEMHESLPVHLRRRRPDGSYYAMGLISRMQTDLAELTQGKRAATYPEVDEYLGYALLAEGLAPRGMSAPDAVQWWRAGGSEVLSERPNIAPTPPSGAIEKASLPGDDLSASAATDAVAQGLTSGSDVSTKIPFIGHPMLAGVNGSIDLAALPGVGIGPVADPIVGFAPNQVLEAQSGSRTSTDQARIDATGKANRDRLLTSDGLLDLRKRDRSDWRRTIPIRPPI